MLDAETDRLERLAREFAEFGRLPEGPMAEVDLVELLNELGQTAVPNGVTVNVQANGGNHAIVGHYEPLRRAFSNLLRNAARTVTDGGLPGEAALTALTVGAARIAGVDSRLGTIQKGRIGNLVVTDGDWLNDKTRIRHVFVDGRPVEIDAAGTGAAAPGGGSRGRGRGAPPER